MSDQRRRKPSEEFHYASQRLRSLWESVPDSAAPPQDIPDEQAILGAALIDHRAVEIIVSELGNPSLAQSPFYQERHALIYKAVAYLASKGNSVDLLTVTDFLRTHKKLEEVGGPSYLVELTSSVVTTVNVQSYCRILLERKLGRDILMATGEAQAKIWGGESVFDTHDELESSLDTLRSGVRTDKKQAVALTTLLSKALIDTANAAGNTGIAGVPSGIRSLDETLGGFMKGDLVVIAARPSSGKTALSVTFQKNIMTYPVPDKRVPIGFWSVEMTNIKIGLRLLSAEAQVSSDRIRRNALTEGEMSRLQEAILRMQSWKLWSQDDSKVTPIDIRSQMRSLQRKGCGIAMVDYLQIIKPIEKGETREREVSEITQSLKDTAKMLNIPVLAMAQLNRSNQRENRPPVLSDLRESGAIEQIADVILFIHHPNDPKEFYENGEPCEIHIAKNRDGPTGVIPVKFFKYYSLFEDSDAWTVAPANTVSAPPPTARNYYEVEREELNYGDGQAAF